MGDEEPRGSGPSGVDRSAGEESRTDLRAIDTSILWHPFTQMAEYAGEKAPIILSGEGCRLTDTDGRSYLDGVSSLWCNLHGHRRAEIDRAIRRQLDLIAHSTLLGLGSVPSIRLADRLVSITPEGLDHCFYSDDGATAVEVALKMAFQYQTRRGSPGGRRKKFLALRNSYHGDTLGAVGVGGIELFHSIFRPLLMEAIFAPSPYCYRCPMGLERPSCSMECLEEARRILSEEGDEIAAVIAEPIVQGAAGMIVMPEGFLSGLADAAREAGALFIADEVATGFGRTGRLFASEWEDVRPDLLCLGKGLTGGYLPVAATMTTGEIFEAFKGRGEDLVQFFHGHTYTGNALGCAAALANLEIFEREDLISAIRPKIELMDELLGEIEKFENVGEVRRKGLMVGIELVRDSSTREAFPRGIAAGRRVILEARRRGVILRPLGEIVVLMPPLAISEDEIRELVSVTAESIEAAVSSLGPRPI